MFHHAMRLLVAAATALATCFATEMVARQWAAGPGHAATAAASLLVCVVFALATILLALEVAFDIADERRLRADLARSRRTLDALSSLG